MKLWKKIAIFTLGLSLLVSGPSVLAASDEQTIEETASQLMEEAENLDPNSTESVENFSRSLESWDTSTTTSSTLSDILNGVGLGTSQKSVQMMFVKLQQQQAQICKDNAQKYIEEIQKQQNTQKQLAELLSQLRNFSVTISQEPLQLTEEIKQNLITLNIYSETDDALTKKYTQADADSLIAKVEVMQENLGSNTQQNMVYIQDFIGQYNSYLQNSLSTVTTSIDTSSSLSKGGTMLGGSMGMLFTGILIGACIGVIAVLVVQKSRKREA